MNITLVRHPQTTANEMHIIYGKSDYHYTQRGNHQLLWLKDYIAMNYGFEIEDDSTDHNMRIISSPRDRALILAEAIGNEIDIEPIISEYICEMDFGIFEGLTVEEAIVKYPVEYNDFQYNFGTTRIPKGESYEDFITRMDNFMEHISYLKNEVKLDEIIVVTHGGVIRELLERLLEIEPGGSWKFLIGNGCLIKLALRDDGYHLKELIANKF
jgi:alpha-ribazole phosphatase